MNMVQIESEDEMPLRERDDEKHKSIKDRNQGQDMRAMENNEESSQEEDE